MPDVRMPDGTIIRNVPEGTTRAQLQAKLDARAQAAKPTSFWQGVREGITPAATNAMRAAEMLNPVTAASKAAMQMFGRQSPIAVTAQGIDRAGQDMSRRSATRGSTAGRIVGGVAGTLPTMALPGIGGAGLMARVLSAPVVQGAAGGALLNEDRTAGGMARDMAIGAAGGKAGEVLARGAGALIGGRNVPKNVRMLAEEGVTLTPGQLAGPRSVRQFVEDKVLGSLPYVNNVPAAARARGANDLRRAVANRVLAPIGDKIPKGAQINDEMIGVIQQKVHDAYGAATERLALAPDEQLLDDLSAVAAANPRRVTSDVAQQVSANIDHVFDQLAQGGLSGQPLREVLGQVRQARAGATGGMKDQLGDIHEALASAVARQNGDEAASAFNAAREAETLLARMEDAAGRAGVDNGEFGPTQLKAAADKLGFGTNRGNRANNTARLGDLANAAADVMRNTTANSGTPDRLLAGSLLTGSVPLGIGAGINPLAGAAVGASMLGYVPGIADILQKMAINRPQVLQQAGRAVERSAPLVGNITNAGLLSR